VGWLPRWLHHPLEDHFTFPNDQTNHHHRELRVRLHGAETLDHATAQVILDALPGGGGGAVERDGAKLEAEFPVVDAAPSAVSCSPGLTDSRDPTTGPRSQCPWELTWGTPNPSSSLKKVKRSLD